MLKAFSRRRQRKAELMADSSGAAQIPMLRAYSEQFQSEGPRAVSDRRGRLFMEICKPKKVTRKQIAQEYDLRPGTVSALVLQLIERGLVDEGRPSTLHKKGRPEILLRPVLSRLGVLVVHVVSQTVHATLVDLSGRELCSRSEEVSTEHVSNTDLEDLFIRMATQISEEAPKKTEIVGISFSLPGIVDENNNRWVFATSRWQNIQNMDFSEISQKLGLNVVVNKNLNCELRARIARRGEKDSSNILFIHWGHGIGASYSMNGTTLVSGNGGFGEIGHTHVPRQGRVRCRCGLDNCLETQAALWALLPDLRTLYPEIPVDEWSFEAFLKETRDFDISQLEGAINSMAVAMRNLTLILSPHQIVLTGPFVQHGGIFERLCEAFREVLPSRSNLFALSSASVVAARAGTEDEIIGAAYPLFAQAIRELCS